MPKKLSLAKASAKPARGVAPLLTEVRGLILAAREQVARAVDSGLVTLYWHIGRRVHQDILKEKRAEYGAEIVSALGRQLQMEFPRRRQQFHHSRITFQPHPPGECHQSGLHRPQEHSVSPCRV